MNNHKYRFERLLAEDFDYPVYTFHPKNYNLLKKVSGIRNF